MYADTVVIAGIGTVLLVVCFFIGVGVFVVRDSKRLHVEPAKSSETSEDVVRKSSI